MLAQPTLDSPALRIDRPPPASARLRPPVDFGRRFIVFGDAEEEFDWTRPFRREATATDAIAALPEATRRFNACGAVPTYLVDYPVVNNAASAATMRAVAEAGRCDIGAQLHPWVTPPFDEDVTRFNSFTGNLPRALQRAKLAALTAKIEAATGMHPKTYRAGRYGVGADTAGLLVEQGYRLDVSVRALFDYSAEGGPDFSRHPPWPYRLAPTLIELPLTATRIGTLRAAARWRDAPGLRRFFSRMKLLGHVSLTPEGMPLAHALEAIAAMLDGDLPIFSLSFHTPSVEPGHTPYVRDQADLTQFWRWWDGVFDAFARAGVTPVRSDEIVAAFG